MGVRRYQSKPQMVQAVQLSKGELDPTQEWDDICDFLGCNIISGQDNPRVFQVRRPPIHAQGNVRVIMFPPGDLPLEAAAGDWIVKHDDRRITFMSNDAFWRSYSEVD
jgi:hypothetical protein